MAWNGRDLGDYVESSQKIGGIQKWSDFMENTRSEEVELKGTIRDEVLSTLTIQGAGLGYLTILKEKTRVQKTKSAGADVGSLGKLSKPLLLVIVSDMRN